METLKEIQDILVKLAKSQAESSQQMEKRDKKRDIEWKKLRIAQAETTEQMKKTDEQMKKTNEQMRKTDEQMRKTDEQMKKTDEQMDKLIKQTKKTDKYVGNMGRNNGFIAEEFFVNSLSKTFEVGGINYDDLYKNLSRTTKKLQGEFDIVMVNGKDIAIIETKYKAHENDVDDLIGKKHRNFKKLFPQYNDYNHHLMLASFYVYDKLMEKAIKNNVTILQRVGDVLETFPPNPPKK